MKPFVYCPSCSAVLGPRDDDGAARCPECGRSWYRHSSPTVGAAVVEDGRALASQRGRDPERGKWDVPGGFLMAGEDPIEGLRREMREETGAEIAVSMSDLLQAAVHTYGSEGDYTLALGFKARLTSGDPEPNDDVAALRWVTLEELDGLDFAWEHDRELLRKALTSDGKGGSDG